MVWSGLHAPTGYTPGKASSKWGIVTTIVGKKLNRIKLNRKNNKMKSYLGACENWDVLSCLLNKINRISGAIAVTLPELTY